MSADAKLESPSAGPAIVGSGLVKTYGSDPNAVHALAGVDVALQRGEFLSVMGPSGSGKSTLLHVLAGLLRPTRGTVLVAGVSLHDLADAEAARFRRRNLGLVFQFFHLIPTLTVEENILVPVWVSKTLKAEQRLAFVYEVLPELKAFRERRALLLSGGQQKMAALGRALAVGTRLLLLDEPFEGLAPALSQRLSEAVATLRGTKLAVLMSQSDLNHSRSLVDREVVIERGANA